MKEGFI